MTSGLGYVPGQKPSVGSVTAMIGALHEHPHIGMRGYPETGLVA